MINGFQDRAAARLGEMVPALDEGIGLKKAGERWSRQLSRKDLREWVRDNLLEMAAPPSGGVRDAACDGPTRRPVGDPGNPDGTSRSLDCAPARRLDRSRANRIRHSAS